MSKNYSFKDIKLGGYCKDCPYAELSIEKKAEVSRENGEMVELHVHCEHENACERMTYHNKNEWIDISEKMPKDDQNVLVTIKKGTIISDSYYVSDTVKVGVFCDTDSIVDGLPYQHFCILEEKPIVLPIDNIASWMPLPEPYKE